MGLEEHLLTMFRDDFEFNDGAGPSHLATGAPANERLAVLADWSDAAERELMKIPFFVRGKARRNTERFAADRGIATISVETLYDAKAHYAR
jgi:light-independent protochlorophyllide reductase subunit B